MEREQGRDDLAERLAEALRAASFTYDEVGELLGPRAHAALGRNETTPGLRRTRDGSPIETLTRLFLLQAPVRRSEAEAALPGLVDRMAAEGFLVASVGEVAARLDVRPYASDEAGDRDLWVVSDLTPGLDGGEARVGADHVLGISPASLSLARLTLRDGVATALDLGTGCGVQALHLAEHADRVVATDVNPRALRLARFNLALNDVAGVEVRDGSFFEPVRGERFDLIATNPPFVISPATGERLVYRDSGLPGDRAVEHIVRSVPDHLTDGGVCQILANWVIARDVPWDERLTGWLVDDLDALVVQREVVDPAEYVEMWLKDSGHHGTADYRDRYDTWVSWLDEQGVEGVGFGWITLRRAPGEPGRPATTRFDDWPHAVEQPIAPAIREWLDTVTDLADSPDLLGAHLTLRADVTQETVGQPGAEDPEAIVLRRQRGFRRARAVDTVEAAVAGACGGDLSLGDILDAVADILDRDPAELRTAYLPRITELVRDGYLALDGGA
ncbi:MAG: methyltransferase [Nocardioidaceae bacterium]|nr:methyltransferase [Nocardioidaceae bacterium]